MLLSALSDGEIDRLVRRINIAEPEHRIETAALIDEVDVIRRQGFVFSRNLFADGVGVIAVLMPQAPFGRHFALGLGGPVERLEAHFDSHLADLRAALETAALAA
jgi:DNA-binding IclR family transcriptional regulator